METNSMSENAMTEYELRQMELYIRKARQELIMGRAIAREDFIEWVQAAATWLLDRVEAAWNWLRHKLGLF